MSKTKFLKILSALLSVMLIAVIAFSLTSCSTDKEPQTEAPSAGTSADRATQADTPDFDTSDNDLQVAEVLGTGKTAFDFKVIDPKGNTKNFEIRTDKGTVGEALLEVGLIEGEDGPYGLYVKTVNGVTVDYDKDGKYWAFYENGQYASKGVDQTPINPDSTYEFRAEKG